MRLQVFLNLAIGRVPLAVWQGNAAYAQALLTAHMLTGTGVGGLGAGGGAVSQEAVGDVSRSFAQVGGESGDGPLMTTRYGIDFVALRKETVVGAMATGPATRPPVTTVP